MRRIFKFKSKPAHVPVTWHLTARQQEQVLDLLSEIGLNIVTEARGPVPLLAFGRRMLERLDPTNGMPCPLPEFADALKHVIRNMRHDRLRVMSPTDFAGVGYVYNAQDPETWPVQSSR